MSNCWKVNGYGRDQIAKFLRFHHKDGFEIIKDPEQFEVYVIEVELNLEYGQGQYFLLTPKESYNFETLECWLESEGVSAVVYN